MRKITFICFAAFLSGCSDATPDRLSGYVEAETLYLAPQETGVVSNIHVVEGDRVKAGDILFRMDADKILYQAEQAEAAASAAEKRADDTGALAKGVLEAQANLERLAADFARTEKLFKQGYVARARYDSDRAALTAAEARLERARAEKEAAEEDYQSVQAQAGFATQRLDDLAVAAPQAGSIERIYRRAGEIAGAGDPVIALLPPGNLKLRFFAPERMLASFAPGKEIGFHCDGCADGLKARITYVAAEPQFTPPVIYSLDERDKFVFLIEARPLNTEGLRTGQPIDVEAP